MTRQNTLSGATVYGDVKSLRFLQRLGHNFFVATNEGNTLVHLAVKYGKLDCLYFIWSVIHKIDIANDEGKLPIHLAVEESQLECLKFLEACGADMHEKVFDEEGNTLGHIATRNDDIKILNYLREIPIKINDNFNNKGQGLVHLAVLNDSFDSFKFLIEECGANPLEKNREGYCPIHLAAMLGLERYLIFLDMIGSDINIKTRKEKTALELSRKYGNWSFYSLFIELQTSSDSDSS